MRVKALALCLMAGFGTGAYAQDSTQTLQQALQRIPQMVLTVPEAMQVSFMDVQAWRSLEKAGPTPDGMRRLSLAQSIRPLQSIGYGLDAWSQNAKIAFDEVSYFAAFGQGPANLTYWGLKDKQAVETFVGKLKQVDFVPVQAEVPGVLANGEANKMDLKKANARDPWRGQMGTTSFVFPLESALVQTPTAEGIKFLAQPKPSVADSAGVAATLAGLKEAVPAKDGRIVQAAVISPVIGLQAVDPMSILPGPSGNLETAKRNLEAAAAAAGRGVPPYSAGIIADAQINNVPALVVSLAYADCASAKTAVDGIGATWKETMPNAANAKFDGRTVQTGQQCAAVVSLTAAKAENAGNPIMTELVNRYIQRQPTLLQIGTSK